MFQRIKHSSLAFRLIPEASVTSIGIAAVVFAVKSVFY